MTRRDYILIAEALRAALTLVQQFSETNASIYDKRFPARLEGLSLAVIAVSEMLKAKNPRFRRDMFTAHIMNDYPQLSPDFEQALAKAILWHEARKP